MFDSLQLPCPLPILSSLQVNPAVGLMVVLMSPDTALAVPLQGNVAHRQVLIICLYQFSLPFLPLPWKRENFLHTSGQQWKLRVKGQTSSQLFSHGRIVLLFISLLRSDVKSAPCSSSLPKSALETQIMKAKGIYNTSWFMVLDLGGRGATNKNPPASHSPHISIVL